MLLGCKFEALEDIEIQQALETQKTQKALESPVNPGITGRTRISESSVSSVSSRSKVSTDNQFGMKTEVSVACREGAGAVQPNGNMEIM